MLFRLLKFRYLKAVRSVSLGRNLLGGLFLVMVGFIVLSSILAVGFGLEGIIEKFSSQSALEFINSFLLFFFMTEMIYRIFLQKSAVIELENFLHLPVGRPTMIHFLLISSFISALNIVAALLFTPFAFTEISVKYGLSGAASWLITIIVLSWSVHGFCLWFKQKYSDHLFAMIILFLFFTAANSLAYYGIFNIGSLFEPFFAWSLQSYIPLAIAIAIFILTYFLAYKYYKQHAYIENLKGNNKKRLSNTSVSLFNRFGLWGEVADLELKLILRHKRSRSILGLSVLFLFYGLLFYEDSGDPVYALSVFLGTFLTGIFILNYGQYFLSWNSPHFDFFLSRNNGLVALVTGKYLLFIGISALCFLLSVPYVYFGWEILLVHFATFLFNIGVNIHFIIYFALWKPKPINLDKGNMFNFEGVGAAQFLMGIPFVLAPYLIYLPFTLLLNEAAGLVAIGGAGLLGLLCHKQIIQLQINRLTDNRYTIASSFRSEL